MEQRLATMELLMAAEECGVSTLKQAIAKGADIRALGRSGRSALSLMLAHAGIGSLPVEEGVRALLAQGGAKVLNADGSTPLMIAAQRGSVTMVSLLLPASDPLAVDDQGRSALMSACIGGDPQTILGLLPVSDPKARDIFGRTALMCLAGGREEELAIARALAPVSDVNALDENGKNALMHFLSAGSIDVARMLLPMVDLLAAHPQWGSVNEAVEQRWTMALLSYIDERAQEKLESFHWMREAQHELQSLRSGLGSAGSAGAARPRKRI